MKKIVITGASRGIGFELCRQLAEKGHTILALTRNGDSLEQLRSSLSNLHVLETDISSEAGIDEVASWLTATWNELDILIHNAGTLLHKPFKETSISDFMHVYKVNVFAVAELSRKLLPFMTTGAHVVGISSMGGIQGSMKFPGLAAYSSSKGALITLMELLAEEYKEQNISFNTLALGAVQTEMLEEAFPGYKAPVTASEMASYIANFALEGNAVYNGKVLQVSNSTP